MLSKQIKAWLVHLYTMSGGVLGMLALFAAADGQIRLSFFMLIAAALIDGTDGMLARKVNVRKVLPKFDGSMVDNVIDVLTYVWVPVFIMGSQGLVPHVLWTVIPIVGALYAYGQVDMKTEDAFFLGFPSYWNGVALYLFWLRPEPVVAVLMVVIPGVLSFIPTRYLYPSKNSILSITSWVGGLIWAALVFFMLLQETPDSGLVLLSLIYPVWYMLSSFWVDNRLRQGKSVPGARRSSA
jgi:phosphatidylcholine synthase